MSDSVTATVEPAAAYYIGRVKRKLATGTYQTEPVACFCGASNASKVTDFDRYGFDHPMWLCKECGVMYANPRMTEQSYAEFYANEYRNIYTDNVDEVRERGTKAAIALRDYLIEQYALRPAVVFDIGCNSGAWLEPFLEAGAQVHGVDYGAERISLGQDKGLPIEVGSIEALEILGLKADLIIMNHVLEHATDIEAMLRRVRNLLSDDGILFVALPGLFAGDLARLFQNAHPWQFTAETLIYVMECCGFEELRADHTILSLWKKSDEYRDKSCKTDPRYIRDIYNFLSKTERPKLPHIRAINKFPMVKRKAYVASSMSRNLPDIHDLKNIHTGHDAIVIGGGPSVDGYIDTICWKQNDDDAIVIAIERMLPWCIKNHIRPDYVVAQDASNDVVEAFDTIPQALVYLVASQCQPAVFDALIGESVYLFHSSKKGFTEQELDGLSPSSKRAIVNAGGSVVICSLSIAMLLGMKRIHLFGFDCHISHGRYANGIAGVGDDAKAIHIKIDGQPFTSTTAYIAFAQQFFEIREIGKEQGLLEEIYVYGDSLVKALAKTPLEGD